MTPAQKQVFKSQAHHLKPVILVGAKGFTEALAKETDIALETHELIKVKLSGLEKEEKRPFVDQLCSAVKAELIQLIGNIALIYRKSIQKNKERK